MVLCQLPRCHYERERPGQLVGQQQQLMAGHLLADTLGKAQGALLGGLTRCGGGSWGAGCLQGVCEVGGGLTMCGRGVRGAGCLQGVCEGGGGLTMRGRGGRGAGCLQGECVCVCVGEGLLAGRHAQGGWHLKSDIKLCADVMSCKVKSNVMSCHAMCAVMWCADV